MTASNHYENFPVGSIILPRKLRQPIHAIYAFARTADDIADEGNATPEQRHKELNHLKNELDLIAQNKQPETELMRCLNHQAITPYQMPLQSFYDLLSAFEQDISKTRYQNFGEVIDYCRRSANPVGRMMLHLYGEHNPQSIAQSDGICTALQLINFWQDIAIDWQKNRVYLPLDDMAKFGVDESDIASGTLTPNLRKLIAYHCQKTHKILKAGSPLGKTLKGRLGLELRLIILGGNQILDKMAQNQYDIFQKRPVLTWKDWLIMIKRAIQQK